MVDIDPAHRDLVAGSLGDGLLPMHRRPDVVDRIRRIFLAGRIPGIVCAPKAPVPEGWMWIGVSFPLREDGVRVRSAVALPCAGICGVHSPWEVMDRIAPGAFPAADELLALAALGRDHGIAVGLFGSAALQALTGLPYMEPRSDVDAVVVARSSAGLRSFHAALAGFATRYNRKYDVEVATPGGLGVKLTELVSDVTAVAGRGIDGVRLVDRYRVLDEIDTLPPLFPVP
ncbi:malonate decarboxylase holo-[acyl-carrier-protein] synthase [Azospirillum thermophilum]|uniref:Malonate decarboxylase holo-[acyl-carrier-protein] synthase n=1 Tax=Azospirillum thermophilum TaxID=2202148 RepID=A0A2S2CW77_9PROT|nr:malonate decarboxylase holo-[acyl-carrier-protein] synthase [Azospirillum thermophilum]AWK88547.1 malonate decarboxylase holo-[acyl-carrier-protein] synthase [Azospirillum thermophilum]